jgi:hypothetical protein
MVAVLAPKRPQSAARVKSPSLVAHMDVVVEETPDAFPLPSAPSLPTAGGSGAW